MRREFKDLETNCKNGYAMNLSVARSALDKSSAGLPESKRLNKLFCKIGHAGRVRPQTRDLRFFWLIDGFW